MPYHALKTWFRHEGNPNVNAGPAHGLRINRDPGVATQDNAYVAYDDFTGRTIQVAGSLGVASSREGQEADEDWLLRAADAALYLAKQRGRNRVELFCPTDLPSMSLPQDVPATPFSLNGPSR